MQDGKSPAMRVALDGIAKNLFGRTRTESIKTAICVACGSSADDFKDAISIKEYTISGMCQKCQDRIFADPEGE